MALTPKLCPNFNACYYLGLLSLHGLVVIRRGRGGGVFASMPSLRGLEVVIDPELRLCGRLQELRDLLTVIREELGSEGLLEKDKVVAITFLDELIEQVDVANLYARNLSNRDKKTLE